VLFVLVIGLCLIGFSSQGCDPETPTESVEETSIPDASVSPEPTPREPTPETAVFEPVPPPPDDGKIRINCELCTILTGGIYFDGSTMIEATIVLKGTNIEQIITEPVIITRGKEVSIKDKFVFPGLIDVDVSLHGNAGPPGKPVKGRLYLEHFKALLRAGVTSILDHRSPSETIFAFRRRVRIGDILSPSLNASGASVTAPGGAPCPKGTVITERCIPLAKEADKQSIADLLFPYKPDLIHIVQQGTQLAQPLPGLNVDRLQDAINITSFRNYPLLVQVLTVAGLKSTFEKGIKNFSSIPSDGPIPSDLLTALAKADATFVTQLASHNAARQIAEKSFKIDDSLKTEVPASVLAALRANDALALWQTDEFKTAIQARWKQLNENLIALKKAGVRLVSGTGAGLPGTFHGRSLHDELALLVKAGLTPLEAIQSATNHAGLLLGDADKATIKFGSIGNLVIFDKNPLEDIDNLSSIRMLFHQGKAVDLASLALDKTTSIVKVPTTEQPSGGLCLFSGECVQGLVCDLDRSRCTVACSPGDSTACNEKTVCLPDDRTTIKGVCASGTGCDLLSQDCANEASCVWLGKENTTCRQAGTKKEGEDCSKEACARGLMCDQTSKTCFQICNAKQPDQIPCTDTNKTCKPYQGPTTIPLGRCE
jgi:imidazolonepropionase-like amidohydrolase